MKGSSSKKVPGGKLVRVDVEFSDSIERIRITGDFFLHPEETLQRIETALVGSRVDDDFERIISGVMEARKAEFIGLDPRELSQTIKEALG